jgi:multidrug resistance efflux pump
MSLGGQNNLDFVYCFLSKTNQVKETDFQIEPNPIEIRSEEVQEIIGHAPNWIVRWGITLIFFVFTVLITVSWFIKYPDIIKASVMITTSPPPLPLVTRASGNLVLIKKENDVVEKGEVIAYLNSTTNFHHAAELERSLENLPLSPQTNFELGELQPSYAALLSATESNRLFRENDIFRKQIIQLKKQVNSYAKLKKSLTTQYQLMYQELMLAHEKFKRDSVLFVDKVIAPLTYEEAQTTYLQQKRNFSNAQASITNNEIQINQLEKQAMELEAQKTEQEYKLIQGVDHAYRELLARIAKWKEVYVLTAPMKGRVAFQGFWENDMFTESGKQLFSVVPENERLFAQAELPLTGSGKVKEGQEVNIKLENFPSEQFGLLRGKVTEISTLPADNKYRVKIEVENALTTTYHKALPFKQQLRGETEIITEDLRLLERVFYQFKSLISKIN